MKELMPEEILRYERQLLVWDKKIQGKLKNSNIFIAGAGGLGSSASIYLAGAGVGKISICDFDKVEITNLNRQILHNDLRIGKNKAESAKKTLERTNKNVEVIALSEKIDENNVSDLIGEVNVIVDCLDNFETRFVLNKYAVKKKIPLVFGAVQGFEGQISFIKHPETFCLACLFEEIPPKEIFPAVGVTPGVIGTLQALEVLKYLTKIGENLNNELLIWDGLTNDFRKVTIKKDPACEICGKL
ncbi:MAG: HesA/MoeB/ThiF family protein [Candidatus Firestonebacteria bacterium]